MFLSDDELDGVITKLSQLWPMTKIIRGRSRHSESNGGIERVNREARQKLANWRMANKVDGRPNPHWAAGRSLSSLFLHHGTPHLASLWQVPGALGHQHKLPPHGGCFSIFASLWPAATQCIPEPAIGNGVVAEDSHGRSIVDLPRCGVLCVMV